jgi:hypothetical protein
VLSIFRLVISLVNCTDARGFVGIGLTDVHYVILQSLWTTAPTIGLDFVGSSDALSPVQPTPFEASVSVQPVLVLTSAGSARWLNRRHSNSSVGSTGELYRAIFVLLFVVVSAVALACS